MKTQNQSPQGSRRDRFKSWGCRPKPRKGLQKWSKKLPV